jgi:DNA-directed RNA polymerase specialized sigma24 family protein
MNPPSETVAKYIPFLRRYARALTGTQSSGDAYVAAALEALIEDPSLLESGRDPRMTLFHMFTKVWKSVAVNKATEAVHDARPPEQRLANLTTLPRQAFLLMALEGFSEEDVAEILDSDIATLRQLVDEAGRELAAGIATDVLIIEDEVLIAIDLERLMESLGHRVIGVAPTHAEAIKLARAMQPGLILADIQLADGSSGMDAVNELMRSFRQSMLSATVSQALFFGRTAENARRRPA